MQDVKYADVSFYVICISCASILLNKFVIMEEINFIYTVGKHVDCKLVYTTSDCQLFRRVKETKGTVDYKCYYEQGCKAKIYIENGVCRRKRTSKPHNHRNQENEYKSFNEEYSIKIRSQTDPFLSPRAICDEVASTSDADSNVSSDSKYRKHRSSIYYNRRKVMPLNPTNLEEAQEYLNLEYVKDILEKPVGNELVFHITSSNEESLIIIFASEGILTNLPELRHAVLTSSMHVVPSSCIFKALLTVSVIKNDDVSKSSASSLD